MVARRKTTVQPEAAAIEESEQVQVDMTNGEVDAATENNEAEIQDQIGLEMSANEAKEEADNEVVEEKTVDINGVEDVAPEGDKPLEKTSNFDNDSAAVVQHLSKLRLSVGPLTLDQIHDKNLVPILNESSGYQIHTPRVLNVETDKNKYAMLDVEFFNFESAEANKEALKNHFSACENVKVENWPENKIYYNDYSYMKIDDSIVTRMKDGVLIAGYSKLRDRWLVALNVDPEVPIEKIKEMVGSDAVDLFRKDSKKRVYIRMDTKDSAKSSVDKSITINGKVIKLKELAIHPSEKKGFRGSGFGRGSRNGFSGGRPSPYQPSQQMAPMPYNQMYSHPYNVQPPQYGYYGAPQGSQYYGGAPKRMDSGYYSNQPYYGSGNSQFQQKRPRF